MDLSKAATNNISVDSEHLTNKIIDCGNETNQVVEIIIDDVVDNNNNNSGDASDDYDEEIALEQDNSNNKEEVNILIDTTINNNDHIVKEDTKEELEKKLDALNVILEIRDKAILEANNKITSLGSYIDQLLKEIEKLKENSIINDVKINDVKHEDSDDGDNNDHDDDEVEDDHHVDKKNLLTMNSKLSITTLNNKHNVEEEEEEEEEEDNDDKDDESEDEDEDDIEFRVDNFLKSIDIDTDINNNMKINYLMHHIINSICTYRYLVNTPGKTKNSSNDNRLLSSTFNDTISMLLKTDNTIPFPIQCLIQLFPSKKSSNPTNDIKSYDWMPFHFAIALTGSNDVSNRFNDGSKAHIDTIINLSDYFGVDVWSNEDVSPLSIAVGKPYPCIDTVELLIKLNPELLDRRDMDGSIPLMHASGSNMETSVIHILTQGTQSNNLLAKDQFGLTSLHYACYSGHFDVVRYITDIKPDTAKMMSSNQSLPIHDATENKTGEGLDIIELLLQIYPGCISIGNENGAIPLHLAARSCPLHVVKFIYNAYNNAIYTQDKEGLLPMHYCSERIDKTNLEVIDYILNLNPSGQTKTIAEMMSPTKRSFFSSASLKNLFTASPKKEESIKPTNHKHQKRKSVHVRN